ncbi:TRCF domain-containing protein, partial [Gordonia sp. (in: high G+C Gram-positive bacteria)]|uniref:TRCF domain-containing protein n=1 Tax=Gordonia sp. (in: high G+C Gram-positive bacteria) TaxID=84139 RepID=UPI0016BA013C
ELNDRYGEPPEQTQRLAAIARLRIRCREHGVTEVGLAGESVKVSPLLLLDSEQVRLARLYKAANYRATTHTVTLPIPRTAGMGSPRLRDNELIDYLVAFLTTIKPPESLDA